jgi:hypothetical protein
MDPFEVPTPLGAYASFDSPLVFLAAKTLTRLTRCTATVYVYLLMDTYRPRLEPRVENRTELPLVPENIARRIVYSLRQERDDLDPEFGQRNGRTD